MLKQVQHDDVWGGATRPREVGRLPRHSRAGGNDNKAGVEWQQGSAL